MNLRTSLVAIAFSLAGFFSAPIALAQDDRTESAPDVVILKDGTEIRGTIVKELIGYVWIDVGGEEEKFLSPGEIESFTRTSAPEPTHKNQQDQTLIGEPEQWERVPGVTRAAILTAEGMVGMQFVAKPLREAIPMLKAEGIDLVVIKVNSGGGMLLEVQAISDVLHDEYKPEFALVGWVDSAISAAAVASLTFEQLYFMPKGNFGASTYSGVFSTVKIDPEPMVRFVESITKRGNRSFFVANAMCHNVQLSYDVDEETGKVSFYDSLDGEHVLNDGTEILTFNANSARDCGFSSGTAGTIEELQALLEKSVGEIVWVGEKVEGIPYPVCKAEQYQRDYRKEVDFQETRFAEIVNKYAMELQNAQSVPVDSRGGFLRRAESFLAQIKRLHNINPNFGLRNGYDGDWIRRQEEVIRQLRRG
ncbi:MAG: hypothetical protein ACIARQ_09520 [Phycisphaerales bacterium JB061]